LKLFLKFLVSLMIGAICVWYVLQRISLEDTWHVLAQLPLSAVAIYVMTLAATHFFRAWRWQHLLRPIGVALPARRLLAISSVGFMAILALPVRLGEFVRPYYVVRTGQSRMSALLGTVAVERIVDGLVISILFFGCYLISPAGAYSTGLRAAAWLSLVGFVTLTGFLVVALSWPERTIRLFLSLTLLAHLAPSLGHRLADKLRALIHGFRVLHQPGDLVPFLAQTLLYWGSNGFGMWLLARAMHLDISPVAAYATMAFTGVLISLPNSPGLLGQFHAGVLAGLAAYLPEGARSHGLAYAIALHGIQFVWYVGVGFLSLFFVGGRAPSLREAVIESNRAAAEGGSGAQ
jgi:glycosyltransferase 2 family protein